MSALTDLQDEATKLAASIDAAVAALAKGADDSAQLAAVTAQLAAAQAKLDAAVAPPAP